MFPRFAKSRLPLSLRASPGSGATEARRPLESRRENDLDLPVRGLGRIGSSDWVASEEVGRCPIFRGCGWAGRDGDP